ncbi:Polyketide cyclase / dehydrase and lipid transport [compost metagenome]
MRRGLSFVLMEAMRFLRILLFSFLVVLVAVVIFGLLAPSDWDVERSVTIKAKPEKIYPYVANFKDGWPQWASYDLEDPRITYTYSGPDEGVGSRREWVGGLIGDGKQVITHADIHRGVAFDIQMIETGFAIQGSIRFDPMADGTKVTWRHYGNVGTNPFRRYTAFTMDRIMGDEFEKSLELLKQKVEAAP